MDSFTDPTSTTQMNVLSHAGQHSNANDAVVAIETYVGTSGSLGSGLRSTLNSAYVPAVIAPAPSGDTSGATDTTAIQAKLTTAQATGGWLVLQAGDYYFNATLSTPQSISQPKITGAGARYTRLHGVGTFSIFTIVGGSGSQSKGLLQDVTLMGAGCTGLELQGVDGFNYDRVIFDSSLARGVLLNNAAVSSFTEFCVGRDCDFECPIWIEYKVGSGSSSFHGSGFRDCVMVQPSSPTGPSLIVDSGAKVYNAPWDGMMFVQSITQAPIKNLSSQPVISCGNLRFEANSASATTPILDAASASAVYHCGSITALGQQMQTRFNFHQCTRAQYNSDGSITAIKSPTPSSTTATTGTTTVTEALDSGDYLVQIELIGSNYIYDYLLAVHRSSFSNSGTITQLANGESNNTAAWGAPTFGLSANGELQVTNNTAGFSVTCYVAVTQTLPRTQTIMG